MNDVIIYKVTNKINGKIYIGLTSSSIEWRMDKHIQASKRHKDFCFRFQSAIKKHGSENFVIEEIEKTSYELAPSREIYWIDYYKSTEYDKGYNMSPGGFIMSKEAKMKSRLQRCYTVYQYDLNGKFISKYNGQKHAEEITGVNRANIHAVIHGKQRQAGGFYWSNVLYETFPLRKKKTTSKIVYIYTWNGNYLGWFKSVGDAKKFINWLDLGDGHSIARAAQGKIKSAHGFIWSYYRYESINTVASPIKVIYECISDSNISQFSLVELRDKGFNNSNIYKCANGEIDKAYGFKWKIKKYYPGIDKPITIG